MTRSGRPREFDKSAVIDAAMTVFWSKGYEACSTEDLCASTGLGRGSLYNAFGSKHELYEQALQHYHENWLEFQTAVLEQPAPVKERLRNLLEWAVKVDFDESNNGCMLINATMERGRIDTAVEGVSTSHINHLQAVVGRLMEEGKKSGEITSTRSAEDLASTFVGSYYGLRTINASTKNREMAQQLVEGTLANIH